MIRRTVLPLGRAILFGGGRPAAHCAWAGAAADLVPLALVGKWARKAG